MNAGKKVALVLIAVGVIGVAYGCFAHTRASHAFQFGSVAFSVRDQQTNHAPIWLGLGAIAIGAGILFFGAGRVDR